MFTALRLSLHSSPLTACFFACLSKFSHTMYFSFLEFFSRYQLNPSDVVAAWRRVSLTLTGCFSWCGFLGGWMRGDGCGFNVGRYEWMIVIGFYFRWDGGWMGKEILNIVHGSWRISLCCCYVIELRVFNSILFVSILNAAPNSINRFNYQQQSWSHCHCSVVKCMTVCRIHKDIFYRHECQSN